MSLFESMQLRRSRYELADKLPVPDEEIERLIGRCLELTPSAFNS